MSKIAILGAGNGGCAAAVDLSLKGFEVGIYDLFASQLTAIKELGGLRYTGEIGEGFCKVSTISENVEEVLHGASLVMLCIPGPGHEAYAKAIAPFLTRDDLVLLNPGDTGGALHFAKTLKSLGVPQPIKVCETNTLSYISRMVEPGKVRVESFDKGVMLSVYPGKYLEEITEKIHQFFPSLEPVDNVLTTSFSNINGICHPPGVILNAGWIEFTHGNYKFYYEGVTPGVGSVIDRLDQERMSVGKALGIELINFPEVFYRAGSTSKMAALKGSAYLACQESEPNKFLKAPKSLNDRYMHEDLNYGIVPMANLGRLAGVATPTIDSLIELACALMRRNYWDEGVCLKDMGLDQVRADEVIEALFEGML